MKSKKKKTLLNEYTLFELLVSDVTDDPEYNQNEVDDVLQNIPSSTVDFLYEDEGNDEFGNDQYQQYYSPHEDESVYSDDVQNAFAHYEQEVQRNVDFHLIYSLFLVLQILE